MDLHQPFSTSPHASAREAGPAMDGDAPAIRPASFADEPERITIGLSHNQALHRYEIYRSGVLAGFLRYSVNSKQLWLLYTEMTKRNLPLSLAEDLIRSVLHDAGSHRVDVFPFCPAVRRFMCTHPGYLALVPAEERPRFQLPDPQQALAALSGTPAAGKPAPFQAASDNGVRRPARRRRNRSIRPVVSA